jgi:hypothetical protein
MFTYEIYDSKGKSVLQENKLLFRNDIGYLHQLKPEILYKNNGHDQRSKEYYQFVIKEPGNYTVKSKAEFQLQSEDTNADFIIYSKPIHFIVK